MLSFDLLAIFTVKSNDSVSFSFLFTFFVIKDQIASFQLNEIVVFLNVFPCVFILLRDCTRVRITTGSEYCKCI